MAVQFKKASRKRVFLKIGLMAPSGAGKTYSAIELAKGLIGGETREDGGTLIAGIDTENGSMSLYSHRADFDVLDIEPPFSPDKYIEAIRAAEAAGYKVLIIDSFSHAWKYLLDKKEKLDKRGGKQNQYTNWGPVKAEADELKDAILQSRIHVIACMRAKSDYVQENGRVTKVGMAAIQEPDVEYEFTTVFQIAMDHTAQQSKDRTELFRDRIFKITPKTGEDLLKWLDSAPEQATYIPPASAAPEPVAPSIETPQNVTPVAPTKPPHPGSVFLRTILKDDAEALKDFKRRIKAIDPDADFKDVAELAEKASVANASQLMDYVAAMEYRSELLEQEVPDGCDPWTIEKKIFDAGLLWWKVYGEAESNDVRDLTTLAQYAQESIEAASHPSLDMEAA